MSCCDGDGSVTSVHPSKSKSQESLSVTKEAAEYVTALLKKDGKPEWGLKIEVMPGGCAGFKYFMAFQEKPAADEKAFEFYGVKFFLSLMSLGLIKGSTVEFVQSLEATGLKVNNPNITRTCGCGKSFG
jgi:iron-sulfur cluster assembly accessory protein